MDIPVVVGDELAHVGGEERLVGIRARDLDVGGALQPRSCQNRRVRPSQTVASSSS